MSTRIEFWAIVTLLIAVASSVTGQINRDMPKYSPTIDGVVSAAEMSGQLVVPMMWPMENGSLLLEGSGFDEQDISAIWYVSWDDTNLNIAGVVQDNTPDYRLSAQGEGNVAYNAQDVIQPVFNPLNLEDHFFVDGIPADDEVFDEVAAIYDMVVETADEFGPDIYRHGHALSEEEHASITIAGTMNADESGYTIEATIPWATAMDDVDPGYVPMLGDEHGLSFILLSFNGEEGGTADIATLFTDFGEGANTIGDPTTWNSVTLVGPVAEIGDFNSNGEFDAGDLDVLLSEILSGNNPVDFDLNGDAKVDAGDYSAWVKDVKKTWIGDSNLDGEFNSTDFVVVFGASQYEDNEALNSTWATGDWNGDGEFNSSDFVTAFVDGGYEKGPRPAAVPEPNVLASFVLAMLIGFVRRQR
jgi:hypothetical protein